MNKRLLWWLVFLSALAPFAFYSGAYVFSPRSLGIDPVEVLLQESGEWALWMLVLTLACSPLRRIGWKGAVRFRRMLGLYTFFYATLHLSVYMVGWVQLDWVQLIDDVTKRSFIYLGMIAWFCLLVLALTSPKAMVKRLKKNWVVLHRLVFLVAVLGWVHLWMQSRASAGEAVLYGAALGFLLLERLYRKMRTSRIAKA